MTCGEEEDGLGNIFYRDTLVTGGPITGRYAGDSLIINYGDWIIAGVVYAPGDDPTQICDTVRDVTHFRGALQTPALRGRFLDNSCDITMERIQ